MQAARQVKGVVRPQEGRAVAESDASSMKPVETLCPFCAQPMSRGFFLIGGGVLFAESTVALGPIFASKPDIDRMLEGHPAKPVHVVVGGKGYHLDPQNWPKPGMFCQACLAVVVKLRDR